MRRPILACSRTSRRFAKGPRCPRGLLVLAFTAFAALAGLAGCYLPPFDGTLAESERFADKLAHVGRLGPVYIDEHTYEGGFFLPSREFDALSSPDGFWMREGDDGLVAAYIMGSSIYIGNNLKDNALGDGFVAFPLNETEVSTLSTAPQKRGIFIVSGSDATTGMPALATIGTSYTLEPKAYPLCLSAVPSGSVLVGASYRIEDYANDRISLLYQSASSPSVLTGGSLAMASSTPWSSCSTAVPTASAAPEAIPTLKSGAFFGYCAANGRYYVSGYREDDSSLFSAYWPGELPASTPETMASVTDRIVAILSSGRLLAAGDGIMELYDLDGNLLTSFTTGNMRFAYEYYDASDGVWYCCFTRAVRSSGNDDKKVIIDVYRWPSDGLSSLGT